MPTDLSPLSVPSGYYSLSSDSEWSDSSSTAATDESDDSFSHSDATTLCECFAGYFDSNGEPEWTDSSSSGSSDDSDDPFPHSHSPTLYEGFVRGVNSNDQLPCSCPWCPNGVGEQSTTSPVFNANTSKQRNALTQRAHIPAVDRTRRQAASAAELARQRERQKTPVEETFEISDELLVVICIMLILPVAIASIMATLVVAIFCVEVILVAVPCLFFSSLIIVLELIWKKGTFAVIGCEKFENTCFADIPYQFQEIQLISSGSPHLMVPIWATGDRA
ncbi:hypothetical protein EJ04DRAFT_521914 [Polyplosphaeria fusca]|uniref:Uncharacterized protein n=1 Tax=Polyplosphaeria fusca TaxID=682080 RepID=A0A9P4R3U4_9PLEO|nr:hypothetical protein EJ04DRAFT_521914 [Polyplosphaeria fusca]